MNRNLDAKFYQMPTVNIGRSVFSIPFNHKLTFNVGDLVPFYCMEVLPGDTFNVDTSFVARLSPLLTPVMDNLNLDIYYFFVPNRLVWEHWKQFMGEVGNVPWVNPVSYSVPKLDFSNMPIVKGTLANFFGLPIGSTPLVNSLPFRAYALIYNEYFRDQNYQNAAAMFVTDNNVLGNQRTPTDIDFLLLNAVRGGYPLKINKYHDYFTSVLRAPQRGDAVSIPITLADVPVAPGGGTYNSGVQLKFQDLGGGSPASSTLGVSFGSEASGLGAFQGLPSGVASNITPINLRTVGLDNLGVDFSVSELRFAFQLQRLLEKSARAGTRYTETLQAFFGVTNPDARLQRPEYLGGKSMPINIQQVLQTSTSQSGTSAANKLGSTGAYSLSGSSDKSFVKSFTEHGFVIGLCAARTEQTYQQGIEKFWFRTDKLDYYWPTFASISEQPVLNKEIYAFGNAQDEVFGFQEAWADYRYKPNRISGQFSSAATASLDQWHLGQYYSEQPIAGQEWLAQRPTELDRALAVESEVSDQILLDILVNNKATRPMPVHSIPGLIDHH